MLFGGQIELGAVHTYLELFARYFVDLTPHVALIAAVSADRDGNLYTGPNTEDTPTVVEATAFKNGVVVAQVNEIVDRVPRVDIPGDRVDFVVEADKPFYVEPLFTRDPGAITETQILMAMMAIKGIYAEYGVTRLNHGIGFDTAAIELLLPTYGERLGLKGKIATHWALNPHPTLIPAIESGWVEQIHCFGSEVGMDDYIRARPGHLLHRRRRLAALEPRLLPDRRPLRLRHVHRLDAADRPDGPFLDGHDSRASPGFGGAPNMGSDPRGRRHPSRRLAEGGPRGAIAGDAGPECAAASSWCRSVETFGDKQRADLRREARRPRRWPKKLELELAPVMIYADDVTHIVTEEGIANLLLCRDARRARAGDPRRRRLHGGRPRPRPGDGRGAARARRHPPPGGSRHRAARRRPEPARRAVDQGSRALVGRALRPPPVRTEFRNW